MEIREANSSEKQKWNDFVLLNKGEFLQSWEWGDFQAATSKNIWRLAGLGDNGEIFAIALIIKHEVPFGRNYLYCPRGPVIKLKIKSEKLKVLESLFYGIKEIAERENSVFLRVEPCKEIVIPKSEQRKRGVNFQPKDTLIMDITMTEEQLLAEMKQKTRYNIRLAEKHGVKIREADKNTFEQDFEKFWSLMKDTASRDGFQSHPKDYYRKMLEILGGNELASGPTAKLFLAEREGKILAMNIVIFFKPMAVYLHGASSSSSRNLMAPYLLQWEQIKKARETGCKEYDFWGIDPQGEKNWGGITRFKKGFGGKEIDYPEGVDFVFQPIIYNTIRVAKRIKDIF